MVACTDYLVLKRKQIKTFLPKNGRSGSRYERVKIRKKEHKSFSPTELQGAEKREGGLNIFINEECENALGSKTVGENLEKISISFDSHFSEHFLSFHFVEF